MIAVGRFDSTFEMTVPDDAVDTQNASEPLDSDANASLTHERVHLTVPGVYFISLRMILACLSTVSSEMTFLHFTGMRWRLTHA